MNASDPHDPFDQITTKYKHLISEENIMISFCPPGWIGIVDGFCKELDNYLKSYKCIQRRNLRNWIINIIIALLSKAEKITKNPYSDGVSFYSPEYKHPKYKLFFFLSDVKCRIRAKKKYDQIFPKECKIEQIKEKFGTLRIYVDRYDDYVMGMIGLTETLSSMTCEVTGRPGSLHHTKGNRKWYKTLSPATAKKLNYINSKNKTNQDIIKNE